MTVSSLESYERQGKVHIGDDKEVEWEEVIDPQKNLTTHVRALAKIFQLGEEHGPTNSERAWDNATSHIRYRSLG